jgi:hypothetical protein
MKTKITTSKSVTDDGNGCAGPMYRDERSIRQMLEDEDADEYEIVKETWRGTPAAKVILSTLKAHGHDINDGTAWLLAKKVDDEGSNPYTHYLLLWEVRA